MKGVRCRDDRCAFDQAMDQMLTELSIEKDFLIAAGIQTPAEVPRPPCLALPNSHRFVTFVAFCASGGLLPQELRARAEEVET